MTTTIPYEELGWGYLLMSEIGEEARMGSEVVGAGAELLGKHGRDAFIAVAEETAESPG